ncbi:hypothetical protein WS83_24670 [Burkholderia sp. MSMB2042]|nr:hypothetical protein WS78_29525 [Burkholderia savannae]KVG44957.1 hypothetical protein WS77_07225 [Burkholderia sp. MSMB0265]KVG89946.1 hypothetical protein WS81_19460 [Burkholderia sp. MSMB2040]KVG96083.1 hypothetical protein WS82_02635 [Burkholderia sp. MSMB2041]KVG99710.1 hypothetical protein WS83_24670 [Burkholderia sp. MSMB2042]
MDRIAQRALEPVAIKFAVRLHMADGRLNRAAPPNHRPQASRDAASQTREIDLHAIDGDALVAAVNDGDLRLDVTQDRCLFQRFAQCVPVVRVARHRAGADHQAFLVRRRDRHLHTKFVWLARLTFRQALDFRRVHRVQLVLVLLLLRQISLRAANQVFQSRPTLFRDAIELTLLMTWTRLAASIVSASSSSTPASPNRLRQRVRLDGSIGGLVCKYSSPAISRGEVAGRP